MTIRNVVALEEVKADLEQGEAFYEAQEPGIGAYFRDGIVSDIESLLIYGGVHERHWGLYRMLSVRFPYAIYYDVRETTAIVVAVLDMRRNPAWIRKKVEGRIPGAS